MKLPLFIALAALLGAAPLLTAATGESPLNKPKGDKPEPLAALEKDPNYKRAPLLIQPQSPLDQTKTRPGGTTESKTPFEWHKNAMHIKAVKRSGQDNPHLGATIKELTETIQIDPVTKRPAIDPNTGEKINIPIPEPESAFEDVPANGLNLKIFRFTNLREFINDGDSEPNGEGTPEARKKALAAAIALGKAFFWDPRFSSDGKVACASCHYAAGTDHRTKGVVSLPANMRVHAPWPQPGSTTGYKPYELTSSDLVSGSPEIEGIYARGLFDPASIADFQVREVIGSIGVQRRYFNPATDGTVKPAQGEDMDIPTVTGSKEILSPLLNRLHTLEGTYRQVTPRNAGTVINAVFNSRNFHDSRASMVFNGHSGFGQHTDELVNDSLFVLRANGDKLDPVYTWNPAMKDKPTERNPYYIANASLASQAMEPILSDVEMSSIGRMFHHIADRMLKENILKGATISAGDSSLGGYAAGAKQGGSISYEKLIEAAFDPVWWKSDVIIKLPNGPVISKSSVGQVRKITDADLGEYSLMKANFGLFWGLAIHLYESTLISENSDFDIEQKNVKSSDRAKATSAPTLEGKTLRNYQPLSAAARRGFDLFRTAGCVDCHAGAEFSAASISEIGILSARGDKAGVPDAATPPPGLFDPLQPPPFEGEEDEIVAGALLCPPEKPLGIECMALNGRFESLYDGGNYNIGISRFIRSPGWPDSPIVTGASSLSKWLYPERTALWEDNGNGNTFIPSEAGVIPGLPVATSVRRAFGAHLAGVASTRLAALEALLAVSSTAQAVTGVNESALLLVSEFKTSVETIDTLITQGALGSASALKTLESYDTQLNLKAGADTLNAPKINSARVHLKTKAAQSKAIADVLGKTEAPALNYTQQYRVLAPVAKELLKLARDPASKNTAPDTLPQKLSQQALTERNLIPADFGNSTPEYRVTPATPVPPFSLARRWFERLNTFIVDAESSLRKAQEASNTAEITRFTQLLDTLRRLLTQTERVADAGAFRVPTLRNIELTGPYMHNGSLLTLEAVVEFYSRGGDYNRRVRANEGDVKSGDQHPEMAPLNLSTEQKIRPCCLPQNPHRRARPQPRSPL